MPTDASILSPLDESSATCADFHYVVELANGPDADDLWIALHTEHVPAGCQVWFRLDGNLTIAVPPSTVIQDNFMVGAMVYRVPPNYTCTIRVFLRLNGQQLPPDARMDLVAYVVPPDGEALGLPRRRTLLGSVTLRP
ncbi:MAG TPA: hypothetical protein VFU36_07845 [Jatrophihabitans sp.]|nr:hypothetical protein [Jatrophihabitans sp.]